MDRLESDNVDLRQAFRLVAKTVEDSMGGTSGAIYAIFFNAVATALAKGSNNVSMSALLQSALEKGLAELRTYTLAGVGHRTLMDALIPFVHAFVEKNDFNAGLAAAIEGTEKTKRMEASLGRSSYVAKDQLGLDGGIPDPGAVGVVSVLKGLSVAVS